MLTDDEMIRSCHGEIQRLRGVIRELQEQKRFLLIKTDGHEIEIFPFDSIEDASKEMERQYQETYSRLLSDESIPWDVSLEKGIGAKIEISKEKLYLWKIVEVPMN